MGGYPSYKINFQVYGDKKTYSCWIVPDDYHYFNQKITEDYLKSQIVPTMRSAAKYRDDYQAILDKYKNDIHLERHIIVKDISREGQTVNTHAEGNESVCDIPFSERIGKAREKSAKDNAGRNADNTVTKDEWNK